MNKQTTYKIETLVKIFTYFAGILSFVVLFLKISHFSYFSAFALFLISIYLEYKRVYLRRAFITAFAIFLFILKFYNVSFDALLYSSLEVLLFLVSLKFLEEKKFRDYMQIYLISVLILAGSTLISFEIIFLAYLFLYILILNISIILLTYHSQDKEIVLTQESFTKLFLKTSLIPLLAIPLTFFFFVILPRTDFPILGFLNKEAKAKTGFSENVRLGEVSEIQEDDTVIFRAKMKKIENQFLYWRGITLELFNGKTWISLNYKHRKKNENLINLKGTPILQTIFLEPYGDKYLFGLDKPYQTYYKPSFINPVKLKNFTFYLPSPIFSRIKYQAFSILTDVIPERDVEKEEYLQIPDNLSFKIKNLADKFKRKTDEETTNQILKFLKYGEFKYSLKELPLSQNPLEEFLFKYKYGNCEYFASSMAILLRLNGIPARLVAGYKGGIYNEVGKYYLVRQSDAHVWVEAFIKNKGWVRYDPTPSSPYLSNDKNFFSKLGLIFETINYYYINFILSYDLKKQTTLIRSLAKIIDVSNYKILWTKKSLLFSIAFIFLITTTGILGIKCFLNFRKLKYEEKLIKRFLSILEKKGYRKEKNEGLEEFISKIKDHKLKNEVLKFVKIFEEFYYKDKPLSKEKLKKLEEILSKVKKF